MASWAPSVNAQALAIAASPDGSTIYVGGSFTQANGAVRSRIAAFSASTGALVANFKPLAQTSVRSLAVSSGTVYFGGDFTTVNGIARGYAAAVDTATGALLAWNPNADAPVNAMTLNHSGSRVVLGGRFAHVGGQSWLGIAAVDPVSAATRPWAATATVHDYGKQAAFLSLASDADGVYGTGYVFAGTGNLEGLLPRRQRDRRHHLDRGLPRRQLQRLPQPRCRLRRQPQSLLRQHRRFLADHADLGLLPRDGFRQGCDRHDHTRLHGLRQLRRKPAARPPALLRQVDDGHLHGAEPGHLVCDRNRRMATTSPTAGSSRRSTRPHNRVWCDSPSRACRRTWWRPWRALPGTTGAPGPSTSARSRSLPGRAHISWSSTLDRDNRHLTYKVFRNYTTVNATPVCIVAVRQRVLATARRWDAMTPARLRVRA